MKKTDLAFTRIELLFCLLGAALLLVPAISLLASNKSESQRIICFNNLRRIGHAFQIWANDHNDMFPWRVPSQPDGGTYQSTLGGNIWFQFGTISNYVDSPRVLLCPSESYAARQATDWSVGPDGLFNAAYRNLAVSYLLSLHAVPQSGTSLLCADRNIFPSSRGVNCSLLLSPVCSQLSPRDTNVRWTNAIHGISGHLLFGDNSVRFTSSAELRVVASRSESDNSAGIHYLSR